MTTHRFKLGLAIRQRVGTITAGAIFAFLYLAYHVHHPNGFTAQVVGQNANESVALVLAAMAQTVPVLIGGIDLSVGAVMTMTNCLASHVLSGNAQEVSLGLAACILVSTAFGVMNGVIVVYGRIQPIIATLATSAIALGLALLLRPFPGGEINETLSLLLTGSLLDSLVESGLVSQGVTDNLSVLGNLPTPMLLVFAAGALWNPFQRTVTGRSIVAVGSSETAAFMSGLPVPRAKIAAFAVSGMLAGCAGVFLAMQTLSGNADLPQAGTYTLASIAAVVIGGAALTGGVGGMLGSVFGALILRVIAFNFRIFEIEPLIQPLVEGTILLAAISVSATRLLRVKNRLDLYR